MYLETETQNFTHTETYMNKHNKKLLKARITSAAATFLDNVIAT
jgi:hypothetical protein